MSIEIATLAGGCFWCLEAVFQQLHGVEKVVSGYTGGHIAKPDYALVCHGQTGHAEAVQIYFDPERISYTTLLDVFFTIHDPTTPNRQGNDIGNQYRSAIFYQSPEQLEHARQALAAHAANWPKHIVTELLPAPVFWPAEPEHQNYYKQHPEQGYCQAIINPKLQKTKQLFLHLLRAQAS